MTTTRRALPMNIGVNGTRDILDRTDRSLAPIPRNVEGAPKRTKHRWADPGQVGEFRWVPKTDLHIDGLYQREEVSRARVLGMAREWNWMLCGALCVSERGDGSLWVVYGGHRTRAVFYRDDITHVPCLIFKHVEVKNEAGAFVDEATKINSISVPARLKAAIVSEDPVAVATNTIIESNGYKATQSSGPFGFSAVGTLWRIVKKEHDMAKRVFGTCADMAGGGTIHGEVLGGLFLLATRVKDQADILTGKWLDRLTEVGMDTLSEEIRRKKVLVGRGGETIAAQAIMAVLNKRRRNPLEWV